MRRLKIEHLTTYQFGVPVRLEPHRLLIRPREGYDIRIESSLLEISPAHSLRWHRDINDNSVAIVQFPDASDTLRIASEVHIQHFDEHPLDFLIAPSAVAFPFAYDLAEFRDLIPYQTPCYPEESGAVGEWVAQFWRPGSQVQTFELLDRINRFIPGGFQYTQRDEPGVQTPRATLLQRRGSCRDFATLFLEACRSLGLASRFVSGYLHCPGSSDTQPGSTHAWSEVYLPGAGWKGFDSTSGELTGPDHIAVAVSRHPVAVPPVSGSFVGPGDLCPRLLVGVRVSVM